MVKIKVGDCPVIIGAYYKVDNGSIVLVTGASRIEVQYRTEDRSFLCTYAECKNWVRQPIDDFPNAKDPKLPYEFDLHYDIKYMSQLKRALDGDDYDIRQCDIPHLIELCKHYDIDYGELPECIKVENTRKSMILALINTAKRTTDLENVYNDETGESFTWDEIMQLVS